MLQFQYVLTGTAFWLCSMCFQYRLKHKGNFRLRAAVSYLCCIAGTHAIESVHDRLDLVLLIIGLFHLMQFWNVWFVSDVSWTAVLYTSVCSGVTDCIFNSFYRWMWEAEHDSWFVLDFVHTASYLIVYGAGCAALFFTIAKWMFPENFRAVGPRQLSSAVMLAMISDYLFYYVNELISLEQYPVNVLLQVYCMTVLYLQNALFRESAVSHELQQMDLMWHQHQKQYQLSRETIAQLNQKSHDLKYKVEALRSMDDSEEKTRQLDDMERTAQIYDHIVRTGNEVLDVLLTEKSLYCQSVRIRIQCIADGKILRFMNAVDLYTLFGNAIDNAIESVSAFQELQDEEKRSIDILIHKKHRFAVIVIRNPSHSRLKYKEGRLVSSKPEKGYHGFGVKSIQHIAKKYGGKASLDQEKDIVSLRIVIPIPEAPSDGQHLVNDHL